jgi:hypothetical protein
MGDSCCISFRLSFRLSIAASLIRVFLLAAARFLISRCIMTFSFQEIPALGGMICSPCIGVCTWMFWSVAAVVLFGSAVATGIQIKENKTDTATLATLFIPFSSFLESGHQMKSFFYTPDIHLMARSSISKISVAFGPMEAPAPRSP